MTEVKKQIGLDLLYDEEGLRMSTPVQISEYKAERLKTEEIADLGCGIGIQALNFAMQSRKVLAVDENPERINFCRENAKKMNLKNIQFFVGDALDSRIIKKVKDADVIHSDPSRRKSGVQWSFSSLSPNPLDVVKKYKCEMISFDLPALMPQKAIPEDWEIEYISILGELKRLSSYVGGAKKFIKSAITLPSRKRLTWDPDISRKITKEDRPLNWIYDLDSSLYFSNMIPEFLSEQGDLRFLHADRQKVLLTSETLVRDPFITRSYSVIDNAGSLSSLKQKLGNVKAKKVFIRYSLAPSSYYEEQRYLEKGLDGINDVYLFKMGDVFYLALKENRENQI